MASSTPSIRRDASALAVGGLAATDVVPQIQRLLPPSLYSNSQQNRRALPWIDLDIEIYTARPDAYANRDRHQLVTNSPNVSPATALTLGMMATEPAKATVNRIDDAGPFVD
jgi:hypothetical protein